MYHYSMLLPKQVREKCAYYSRVNWAAFQNMERWAHQTFFERKNLFAVCNTLQDPLRWLEGYDGINPKHAPRHPSGPASGYRVPPDKRHSACYQRPAISFWPVFTKSMGRIPAGA